MKIYISGIEPFLDLNGLKNVTEERQNRISKMIRPRDKARSLVSGLLLRSFCGLINENQLMYGKNGKPYLRDGSVYFNLSHSGEYVVLAVSDREVGVDIEKIKPYPKKVATRFFTQKEQAWLESESTDENFFRIWTGKESVMKAAGQGLSMQPQSLCVLSGTAWFLEWFLYDNHMICLAANGCAAGNKQKRTEIESIPSSVLTEC
jgi:phosphopantetheinyl transferase